MQSRLYSVTGADVNSLLSELEHFFHMNGHQVQTLPIGNGHVLQAQKETTLSAIMGHSSALTIKVIPEAAGIRVEIGSSKWIDKAAVGVIGYVIMPVLAIIPIIGVYNQYRLGEDAWRIVNAFMARHQSQKSSQQSHAWSQPMRNCTACGAAMLMNAAFCSSCGAKTSDAPVCGKCGTSNQQGARFCSGCGEKMD